MSLTGVITLKWTFDINSSLNDVGVLYPTGSSMVEISSQLSSQSDKIGLFLDSLKESIGNYEWYSSESEVGDNVMQEQVRGGLKILFESSYNDGNDLLDSNGVHLSLAKIRTLLQNKNKMFYSKFISVEQVIECLSSATEYNKYIDVNGIRIYNFSSNDVLCFGVDILDKTLYDRLMKSNGTATINVDRWIIKLVQV
jgi:hypothetical protein